MAWINKHKWLILALVIIAIYLSPLFLLGKDSHVRIHDHLDSSVVWYKTLADSGKIFAANDATIPNMMNGLPREALGSEFKLLVWLFVLFPPFVAHTINAILVRFIAFIGMYLLLDKLVLRTKAKSKSKAQNSEQNRMGLFKHINDSFLISGVALCFALLPFYLPASLSIAGIPLAAYAFLNIRYKQAKLTDWLIILLLPFAASFVLTFFFFLAAIGILWLWDGMKTKQWNKKLFAAVAVMTAIFLAKNYRLITGVLLGHGFTSQREEFSRGHNTLQRTFGLAWENFSTAHTHAYTLQHDIILYVGIFFVIWIFIKQLLHWLQMPIKPNIYEQRLVLLMILAASFSTWYAFWYWQGFRVLKDTIEITNTFNFGRTHFLNPILWYLIFALGLKLIMSKFTGTFSVIGKLVVVVLIIGQLQLIYQANHEVKYRQAGTPSWQGFYSPDLFSHIQDYIGRDPSDYRVASIGMHPAIAQYNGFYTLDMYVNLYPLAYKHQFRKIIAPELAKNDNLASYFDTWGSRSYLFVDELGKHYMFKKHKDKIIDNLDINTKIFKEMGGDYILSAVKITNAKENQLALMHIFENNVSPWRIYLYKAGDIASKDSKT